MSWAELPAVTEGNSLLETWFSVGSERNYSMLYDKSTYTAYWVAYPLISSQTSGGGSSSWKITPGIDQNDQINIWTGSYNVNVGATTSDNYDSTQNFYARGHQIPNGDRSNVSDMRSQTYYAANSTPQIQNGFNAGIWQSLEEGVRATIPASDTLYVVTGAILRTKGGNENITYIQPKYDTKWCPLPNYYYKVLLKCKRDGNGVITSASTIGFWFDHRSYSGESYTSYATSVADIQQKTGYDFFANLPAAIAQTAEQNTSWSAFTSF